MSDNLINIVAAEHPISSVTIFKSAKAEIVRTFELDLMAGRNQVEIRGLSSRIDTNAVRVSGLTDGARLLDVVCMLATRKQAERSTGTAETLRKLQVEKSKLESSKGVRVREAELLYQYGQTLAGQHITPTQMTEYLESYLQRNRDSLNAVSELDEKILAINQQIEEINEQTAQRKGSARGEVTAIVLADAAMRAQIKLTYIVDDVSWVPTYELHATAERGKPSSSVSLHYRARITQSTGEDWKDTSLTLSTISSDSTAKKIPNLFPVKIRPQTTYANRNYLKAAPAQQQQQQLQQQQVLAMSAKRQRPAASSPPALPPMPPPPMSQVRQASGFSAPTTAAFPVPMAAAPLDDDDYASVFEEVELEGRVEPTTIVSETPVAISYSVHGKSTIPSDGVDHQVSVAILPFDAQIAYVTVPRIEPLVYLQCTVKNTSEYRLLSGPVSVILDDSYVSLASISDINTGDTFVCTLGDDSTTKVSLSRKSRTEKIGGGAFTEAISKTTHTTTIKLHNKHQFSIENLVVRDVIPTVEDSRVKVILRKPDGLANTKEGETVTVKDATGGVGKLTVGWESLADGKGGEKEGRFEWKWGVGSGEKVTLEAEWEVRAPSDLVLTEVHHRSG